MTEKLIKCDRCGSYHPESKMEDAGSGNLCPDCYGDAIVCEHCGKFYHIDDMTLVYVGEPILTGPDNNDVEWLCTHCLTPDRNLVYLIERRMNMKKYWYAVMKDAEDDDWGTGSYDYSTAVDMVQQYLSDGGYIAVIDEGGDPICVEEIRDIDGDAQAYAHIPNIRIDSTTRTWKVYGADGHRQRESFGPSLSFDTWPDEEGNRDHVEVLNSDKTGTNEYSIVRITAKTAELCERGLWAQISDGIFENSNVGEVEEIL